MTPNNQTILARHFKHATGNEPCAQFVAGRWLLPRDKDSLDLMLQEMEEDHKQELDELEAEIDRSMA